MSSSNNNELTRTSVLVNKSKQTIFCVNKFYIYDCECIMAGFTLELPAINGSYELGLIVGGDTSLDNDFHIPILRRGNGDTGAAYTAQEQYENMLKWAWGNATIIDWNARTEACAAITGIMQLGLLRERSLS